MPRFLPISLVLLLAALPAQTAPAEGELQPPPGLERILRDELLAHAAFLADDARGGRLTGSPGQQEAAAYIAGHFASLGLEPLGDEVDGQRSFLQHYGVTRTHVLPATSLRLGGVTLADGFAILAGKPIDTVIEGKLRFCGLGRTRGSLAEVAEAERLDGRIAVVVVRPPRGRVDRALTVEQKFGLSFRSFGQLGQTTQALEKKGAAAVLFLLLADPMGLSDVLNTLALSPGKDLLAARFEGASPGFGGLGGMLAKGSGAPSFVLSMDASARLLDELAVDRAALEAFVAGGDELPTARADVDGRIALAVAHDAEATASNVVAVLRGVDPTLAAEAIVYSAHMDHVGRRLDGEVFNGADDNASGSAGLLAIATAFAKATPKPRRSVIFLSVSGEELGLWGSAFFAEQPTWPLDRIVANVNTDMIGRSGPESGPHEVAVTPSHLHTMYSTLVRDAAAIAGRLDMAFTSGDKYYERSDHYNFAKKGIPVVFFCNGEHEDYHQVTDHADKLDGDKMQRIARLAYWTGWSVANAEEAPRRLGRREGWR
ncbi:MAG: M28 family peptidase [Planctomycetes bacterium]|nr:M28 family peptidase [Planctomycetota bacterium]